MSLPFQAQRGPSASTYRRGSLRRRASGRSRGDLRTRLPVGRLRAKAGGRADDGPGRSSSALVIGLGTCGRWARRWSCLRMAVMRRGSTSRCRILRTRLGQMPRIRATRRVGAKPLPTWTAAILAAMRAEFRPSSCRTQPAEQAASYNCSRPASANSEASENADSGTPGSPSRNSDTRCARSMRGSIFRTDATAASPATRMPSRSRRLPPSCNGSASSECRRSCRTT